MFFKMRVMMNNFYVYVYLDTSCPGRYDLHTTTLLFKPLYIGKGKNDRYLHGVAAITKSDPSKTNRRLYSKLKNRISRGHAISVIKICENLTNEKALFLEEQLINDMGRADIDFNGILTNRARGGEIPDTTGLPPPNKGKHYSDYMSGDKLHNAIQACKMPMPSEAKNKMVSKRRKNGTYYTGNNHALAKRWIAINPHGLCYELHGNLKVFCSEQNLSWQTLYNNIDSGPILLDRKKYKNTARLSIRFWNTIGWQLVSI